MRVLIIGATGLLGTVLQEEWAYNRDLARVIVQLVRAGAGEILHAANDVACSWFEFASAILHAAGLSEVTVEAVRTEDVPRPAPRPRYSVLATTKLEQYGLRMRHWQDTLPTISPNVLRP